MVGAAGQDRESPRSGSEDAASPRFDSTLDLLARYRDDGDRGALDALLARYRPRLRRIVEIRMKARAQNRFDASDIVQATLVRAVEGLRELEFREDAKLINWLAKVAERQLLDQVRAGRALMRDERLEVALGTPPPSSGASDQELDPAAEQTSVPGRAARAELKELVDACLAELPDNYREVILLREYASGTWRLIAEELGSPSEDAARQTYARAREALRELVRRLRDDGDP